MRTGRLGGKGLVRGMDNTCHGQGADRVAVMMMVMVMITQRTAIPPISANKPVRVASAKFRRMQRVKKDKYASNGCNRFVAYPAHLH